MNYFYLYLHVCILLSRHLDVYKRQDQRLNLHVLFGPLLWREGQIFFPYHHWWWNMDFVHQFWVETTIHAVTIIPVHPKRKIQGNEVSKEGHGDCVLGPKGWDFGRFYRAWNNCHIPRLLWNTFYTEPCHWKSMTANAEIRNCSPSW